VVRDELAAGVLRIAAELEGVVETFFAVTLRRRFPNPLIGEALEALSKVGSWGASQISPRA